MSLFRNKLTRILMKSPTKLKPQLLEAAKKTKWNIVRGDTVQVIGHHPERGKQGVVLAVNRKIDRVFVQGVNVKPRRIKGNPQQGRKGTTLQKECGIHYSNVNLIDPVSGQPTRVTRKYLEDGTKVRIAKKSGAIIPRPEVLSLRKRPVSTNVSDKCTLAGDVWEHTYVPYP